MEKLCFILKFLDAHNNMRSRNMDTNQHRYQ